MHIAEFQESTYRFSIVISRADASTPPVKPVVKLSADLVNS